jgi:acetoin utilization protein AcuC
VKLTHDLIQAKGIIDGKETHVEKPRIASEEEILLFHDQDYVRLVKRSSEKGGGLLDLGDTPAFKGCYEATSLVVGASLQACDLIMNNQYVHAFNPSGGLHHAHPDRASGFCIFNDPAVSIAYLKKKYNLKRLVYLDIDAHHGDGVMYGFYDDAAVLDIDFHENGRYIFPGTGYPSETGQGAGKGLKVNIPLLPGTGDEAFLEGFESIVPALVREYHPEAILVQCGADGHDGDLLAQLRLTTHTYQEVVRTMHELAHELCAGRLLLFGGGGYTVANVPRVWTLAFASLTGRVPDDSIPKDWATTFEKSTGEAAPKKLFDVPTKEESDQSLEEVESVLMELDREIGWKPSGV